MRKNNNISEKSCTINEKKKTIATNICFYLCLCLVIACFFPKIQGFSDELLRPKWVLFEFFILISLLILGLLRLQNIKFTLKIKHGYCVCISHIFSNVIILVAFMEAVYAIVNTFYMGRNTLVGTFDNPAGLAFCLCVSLPFYFYCLKQYIEKHLLCLLITFGAIVVLVVIILSKSRSGWICLFIYFFLFLHKTISGQYKFKLILFLCLIGVLSVAVFTFKTGSTTGRRFILERSWDLIKEKPIIGYGKGGFKREYMLKQADYFRLHKDSQYIWFASEVYHPLNEFIWVWIEYGILGLLLFIGMFIYFFIRLFRKKDDFSFVLMASLFSVFIFSLFSYPFKYPLAWLVCLFCIIIMYPSCLCNITKYRFFRLKNVMMINTAIIALIVLSVSYRYEYEWNRAAQLSLRGYSRQMMPRYAELYKKYSENALFLYNYTAELFYANYSEKALEIARECMLYWPSYNLSLLTGDICRSLGRYDESLVYYEQAHFMCPVRFAPFEGLYYSYKYNGEYHKADSIANIIEHKKIKINSFEVQRIKNEIKSDINK